MADFTPQQVQDKQRKSVEKVLLAHLQNVNLNEYPQQQFVDSDIAIEGDL